ncbi:MAG TPA: hypothetical protein VHY22_18430 [Chthoniobacteraceae bacterium]|nr:hypothetical protein [Chthoniobacteraceae bacterium]
MNTANEAKPEVFNSADSGIWFAVFAAAGFVGLLGSLIGAFLNITQFGFSWLVAAFYFFTLSAGCLFWLLIHHATDAEWSVMVRRVLENVAVLVPVALILLIPAFLCASHVWSWWSIPVGKEADLDQKRWYLSHGFFLLRYCIYFVLLTWVATSLRRSSVAQDADGNPKRTLSMRRIGIAGIPIFAFSITFGAFDWLMGLDYRWGSTMWGVYIFAGTAGSAMALLILLTTWLRSKGYLKGVTIEHYHIMGKLLLAFTIFWAYIGFSQYMLDWYANIPEETEYFIRRNITSWHTLSTILVIGRFFLPFPLLLLQWTKKTLKVICSVAGWILVMQYLDLYIIIMPMLHKTGFAPSLLDVFPFLGIGGVMGVFFLWILPKNNLFPQRDPRLPESLRLSN